jgi:hypothetical protein
MDATIEDWLDGITPDVRRRDARTLVELYARVTGQRARLRGSIVGFGHYEYRYASGRTGDGPGGAFAARKPSTVIYLADGNAAHASALARLGPHTTGVGCLYIKDLSKVDLAVLEGIIRSSYATVTAGIHGNRAREGSEG